jgi:hypothetical protein
MNQRTEIEKILPSDQAGGTDRQAIAPKDQPAPLWMSKGVYFFRIGIAVFLALSLFLTGCQVQPSIWQPATDQLTSEQITAIASENSSFTASNVPADWIAKMQIYQLEDLLIVNFNQPGLCSPNNVRCTYVGYVRETQPQSLKQVFSLQINPNLPPNTRLFEPAEMESNGLPCFKVNQVGNQEIIQSVLCFNGTAYVVQSKTAKPLKQQAAGKQKKVDASPKQRG